MSQIDKSKEYTTRSGKPVRIYATDGGGEYTVHGAVWNEDEGLWEPNSWTAGGRFWARLEDHPLNLIEKPRTVTHKLWVNVYEDRFSAHPSEGMARAWRGSGCIETREIEIPVEVKP